LRAALAGSDLPFRSLSDIQREVDGLMGGKPERPHFCERPVAIVKWVDGTVLDTVWEIDGGGAA
jgi:citrate lyase subunit alpha/citrate CoA-transferase